MSQLTVCPGLLGDALVADCILDLRRSLFVIFSPFDVNSVYNHIQLGVKLLRSLRQFVRECNKSLMDMFSCD